MKLFVLISGWNVMGEHETDEINIAPPVLLLPQCFAHILKAFNGTEFIFHFIIMCKILAPETRNTAGCYYTLQGASNVVQQVVLVFVVFVANDFVFVLCASIDN